MVSRVFQKKFSEKSEWCNQPTWKPTFCIPNASGMHVMSFYVIFINFCRANFYVTCHSSDQDSRGPPAQDGSPIELKFLLGHPGYHKSLT